jgi:foldase protein PrsA
MVRALTLLANLLVVGGLTACGGDAPGGVAHGNGAGAHSSVGARGAGDSMGGGGDFVVARVGDRSITKVTLDHWASMVAPGGVVPGSSSYTAYIACVVRRQEAAPKSAEGQTMPAVGELREGCRQPSRDRRRQALGFLISSDWLVGEAAARGLAVPAREVQRRFQALKSGWLPGGEAELREFLQATGQTEADVRLAVEAELASSRLSQMVVKGERRITPAQIARYYRENFQRFQVLPEERFFDILEHLKSKAAVGKVKREVASGKSFARMTLHESLVRPRSFAAVGANQRPIERAVFSTRPGVLGGPVKFDNLDTLFEVTRIVPATRQTLAQAEASIKRWLATEQHRRVLAGFVRSWRRRWTARTDCRAGYVVQKCRQYPTSGSPPGDPYTLN